MNTKLIEAAKQALEALQANQPVNYCMNNNGDKFPVLTEDPFRHERNEKAITALRAALADNALDQMAENARELGLNYESNDLTIAYMSGFHDGKKKAKREQPAQDEPVAYSNRVIGGRKWLSIHASKGASDKWLEYRRKEQAQGEQYEQVPLYTRPQAREPLTEDERLQLRCQWIPEVHGPLTDYLIQKTEAAHNIKEKKT